MIHHPDRNPNNQEEATARFQRIQPAYEILSNPAKRARYDNLSSSFLDFDLDDDDYYDEWDDEDDDIPYFTSSQYGPYDFPFSKSLYGGFPSGGGCRQSSGGSFNFHFPFAFTSQEEMEMEEEKLREEEARAAAREELRKHREAERARLKAEREAKQKAKQQARQEAEQSKEVQKKRDQEDEKKQQEQRWKDLNAVTKDEKLAACLHSDFCKKIQQKKRFKCSACSAKRGMIAFECPHCSAFLCQLCVTKFSNSRKKLEVTGGPKVAAQNTQSTQSHDENVDTAFNGEANMGTKATFTDPTSSQKKVSKKNMKNNLGTRNAESAGTSPSSPKDSPKQGHTPDSHDDDNNEAPTSSKQNMAQDGLTKSNQEAAAAAAATPEASTGNNATKGDETSFPGASELPQKNNTATAADMTFSEKTTSPEFVNDTVNNGKHDTVNHKSQEPGTPRPATKPTPGATRGFIRYTKLSHRAPDAHLRRAMEQFGNFISLKVKNKRIGNANVEFADHEGLCKAMAASPVAVNDHVAVEVAELRECGDCGKSGHTSQQCRGGGASNTHARG
ncbi:J protein JJJ1 [Cytospora mali]|uniref:J protein JJJ1 n=1 Tax=Cytospora mali TaxID=578113 RepID=A0A194VGC0_CYTMA|nr:J protein JJJ1 [Valsa mali var. pyri (nom. inval.)]